MKTVFKFIFVFFVLFPTVLEAAFPITTGGRKVLVIWNADVAYDNNIVNGGSGNSLIDLLTSAGGVWTGNGFNFAVDQLQVPIAFNNGSTWTTPPASAVSQAVANHSISALTASNYCMVFDMRFSNENAAAGATVGQIQGDTITPGDIAEYQSYLASGAGGLFIMGDNFYTGTCGTGTETGFISREEHMNDLFLGLATNALNGGSCAIKVGPIEGTGDYEAVPTSNPGPYNLDTNFNNLFTVGGTNPIETDYSGYINQGDLGSGKMWINHQTDITWALGVAWNGASGDLRPAYSTARMIYWADSSMIARWVQGIGDANIYYYLENAVAFLDQDSCCMPQTTPVCGGPDVQLATNPSPVACFQNSADAGGWSAYSGGWDGTQDADGSGGGSLKSNMPINGNQASVFTDSFAAGTLQLYDQLCFNMKNAGPAAITFDLQVSTFGVVIGSSFTVPGDNAWHAFCVPFSGTYTTASTLAIVNTSTLGGTTQAVWLDSVRLRFSCASHLYLRDPACCSVVTPTPTFTSTNTSTPTLTSTKTNTPTLTPTKTFTNTATSTPTYTSTLTPTLTPTVTPTKTFTNSLTPTNTFTPTLTVTPTNTFTVTPTPTWTNTVTLTPTWTLTVTITDSPTLTPTGTLQPTNTFTVTPTFTNTSTLTATDTSTWTPTITNTLSPTNSITATNSPTVTPTDTFTLSPTYTPPSAPTNTPTPTPTNTLTLSPTNTLTATQTNSPSFTATATPTATFSRTFTVTPTSTLTLTSTSTPTPAAAISKSVSNNAPKDGDTVIYDLGLNVTGSNFSNVIVSDTIPAGMTFVSAPPPTNPAGTLSVISIPTPGPTSGTGTLLVWNFPSVGPGNYSLSYSAKAGSFLSNGTSILNQAALTSSTSLVPQIAQAALTVTGSYTVKVDVYNEAGEIVKTILVEKLSYPIESFTLQSSDVIQSLEGSINIVSAGGVIGVWDGTNNNGTPVTNGKYYIKIDNIDALGSVTTVTQPVTVNRSLSQITVLIYNEAGEVVAHIYSNVDDAGKDAVTGIQLSGHIIEPDALSTQGIPNQISIYLNNGTTVVWTGKNDSGGFVQDGQYFIELQSANGQGGETVVTQEVTVTGNGASSGVGTVSAGPNVLNNANGMVTTFKSNSSISFTLRVKLYAVSGELVAAFAGSSANNQVIYNASGLASGLYFAVVDMINSDGGKAGEQIVKMIVLH